MFEIYSGSENTMKIIAHRKQGAVALNPKTMRHQSIDKSAKYTIRVDKTIIDEYSPTGYTNIATLLCDKDLRAIAGKKGLIF